MHATTSQKVPCTAEVGFVSAEQYWSKGYASESVAAVLQHGHETWGLARIVAITAVDNWGSMAVLDKVPRPDGCVKLAKDGPELKFYVSAPQDPR